MSLDIHVTQYSDEKQPDLLSLAGQLAEAARHLLEHTEHKGNACKLLAVGQTTNALEAWDAAQKGRK